MEGLALGLSLGTSIGISIGLSGIASERKKLRKQIRKAIDDKEISIQDKNGEPLTIKALFECLDKNYKKV
ncbi:MAG: hypothetical protein MJE68_26530 [Proteobacteria bacterium]|nr:hypothetical protein [Pseudomonadota bacterium]